MTTLVYENTDTYLIKNHDKARRVASSQLLTLGHDIVELAEKAKATPGKPVIVPGARDARPRHSRVYSHILQ
jgi:hypothetical protein